MFYPPFSGAASNVITTRRRIVSNTPVVNTNTRTVVVEREEPIAIVRSVYNAPSGENQAWDYSYEAANGIKQASVQKL